MRRTLSALALVAVAVPLGRGQDGAGPPFRPPTLGVQVVLYWEDLIELDRDDGKDPYASLAVLPRAVLTHPLDLIKRGVEERLFGDPLGRPKGTPLGRANTPGYELLIELDEEGASDAGGLQMTLRLLTDQSEEVLGSAVVIRPEDVFEDANGEEKSVLPAITNTAEGGALLAAQVLGHLEREWLDRSGRLLLAIWKRVSLADAVVLTRSTASDLGCAFPFTYDDLWVLAPTTFAVTVVVDARRQYTFTCDEASITYQGTAVPGFDGGVKANADPGNERDAVYEALVRLARQKDLRLSAGVAIDLGEQGSAQVSRVVVQLQAPPEGQGSLSWNKRRRERATRPTEVGRS